MKSVFVVGLMVLLAGCSTTWTGTKPLTAEEAGALAQRLANQKAQALYQCQPFRNGPPAEWVQGHWNWHRLQAQGHGDMEARVEFEADGSKPSVTVMRLESIPRL